MVGFHDEARGWLVLTFVLLTRALALQRSGAHAPIEWHRCQTQSGLFGSRKAAAALQIQDRRAVIAEEGPLPSSSRFAREWSRHIAERSSACIKEDSLLGLQRLAANGVSGSARLAAVDWRTSTSSPVCLLDVLTLGLEVRLFRSDQQEQENDGKGAGAGTGGWRSSFRSGRLVYGNGVPVFSGVDPSRIVIEQRLVRGATPFAVEVGSLHVLPLLCVRSVHLPFCAHPGSTTPTGPARRRATHGKHRTLG